MNVAWFVGFSQWIGDVCIEANAWWMRSLFHDWQVFPHDWNRHLMYLKILAAINWWQWCSFRKWYSTWFAHIHTIDIYWHEIIKSCPIWFSMCGRATGNNTSTVGEDQIEKRPSAIGIHESHHWIFDKCKSSMFFDISNNEWAICFQPMNHLARTYLMLKLLLSFPAITVWPQSLFVGFSSMLSSHWFASVSRGLKRLRTNEKKKLFLNIKK